MGSPSSLGEEENTTSANRLPRALQWGRRGHSAKSSRNANSDHDPEPASMGSPSSLGEEAKRARNERVRRVRFNGVAEFTRRRAGIRRAGSPGAPCFNGVAEFTRR